MPQIRMRDATGVLRTITRIRMRDDTGVLRTIQQIRMRDATGVLRTVFQYLSVTLNDYTVYASASGGASNGLVTSGVVTGTVTGGTAPFTYLWEYVSGLSAVNITTPNAANTTFSATRPANVAPEPAYFRLKVTDANGAISYSPQTEVTLEWYDTR